MTVFKVAPDGMQFAVSKMTWRRRWMLGLETRGVISLDKGAAEAIRRKKSLFAAGSKGEAARVLLLVNTL